MTSDGSHGGESDAGVKAGDVLAGKYRVEHVLGVGGMGVVVAAHHLQLDERVALKFLLPAALSNPEAVSRFEREARAAVKIKSEHVARVIDVGKLDNGAPYMVMEYLEGADLSGMIEKMGRLQPPQAVDFVLQAGEAIAEAHSLGIVHRDLKPANLFCIRRRDGQLSIKVLDFGISKLTAAAQGASTGNREMSMTKTTAVVGSPVYMSPEQMQSSKGVDHRTDIWSIGVILYELLTGHIPFDASTVTELAIRIATEVPPKMPALPGLPSGLEGVVLRCLEKDRARRFQNMAEMAEALAPFGTAGARTSLERIRGMLGVAAGPVSAVDFGAPSTGSVDGTASTAVAWQNQTGSKRGGKVAIGVGASAAALVAVVGAALALHKSPAPPAAAAAAQAPATTAAPIPSATAPAALTPAAEPQAQPQPAPVAAPVAVPVAATAPPAVTAGHAARPATVAPHPGAPTASPPPAAAPAKARCEPPYYFDAQGNRVFKPECM